MNEAIPIAYVRRAHGIGGDVVVRGLVADADDRFVVGASLTTGDQDPLTFEIIDVRLHKGDYLLTLGGVSDRGAAEQLVGTQFVIDPDQRRSLDEGEWWAEDLVGCTVETEDGEQIGLVDDVVTGAAQDRLVVRTPDDQFFEVPFVDELVPRVLVDQQRVIVDLPPGLAP